MARRSQSSSAGYWIIGGITVAVFLIIATLAFFNSPLSVASKTNREIVQTCTTDMATQFHIHPHLEIVVNGQMQEIPAQIGIEPSCMHPIHTHDNSGTIHVESPVKRDFTLADFFFIWNKPFNKNQILDYKTDPTHVIRETINGKETQDYENTILRDKDEIVIFYEVKNKNP